MNTLTLEQLDNLQRLADMAELAKLDCVPASHVRLDSQTLKALVALAREAFADEKRQEIWNLEHPTPTYVAQKEDMEMD